MIVTIAPMVNPNICEPPYFLKIFEHFKDKLDDSYHFIIARTNTPDEIEQFKSCIKSDKKNILILLSDESGIKIPYFLEELFLVFRTYSNKNLHDNEKIFPVPCGYSCGYGGFFGKNDWKYLDMEKSKTPLMNRKYDIFYSGQLSPNRVQLVDNLIKIKNSFNSIVRITNGFANGYNLDEYYELMQNSKIAIVPNGAVVPESFRYFEAFESNCIVISTFPVKNNLYKNWFYDESPAIFLDDWNQLSESMIRELLTERKLLEYQKLNKEYFDKYISTLAISNYIIETIKNYERKNLGFFKEQI